MCDALADVSWSLEKWPLGFDLKLTLTQTRNSHKHGLDASTLTTGRAQFGVGVSAHHKQVKDVLVFMCFMAKANSDEGQPSRLIVYEENDKALAQQFQEGKGEFGRASPFTRAFLDHFEHLLMTNGEPTNFVAEMWVFF
jgi:hypothetical protein